MSFFRFVTDRSFWKSNAWILIIVTLGSLLRLIWPGDMEWKGDEALMFHESQRRAATLDFPALGITSSVGAHNPGMSLWLFIVIAFFCKTPVAMTRPFKL